MPRTRDLSYAVPIPAQIPNKNFNVIPKSILGKPPKPKKLKLSSKLKNQWKSILKVKSFKSKVINEYYKEISISHVKINFKHTVKIVIFYLCGTVWLNDKLNFSQFYTTAFNIFCLTGILISYITTMFVRTQQQLERLSCFTLLWIFLNIIATMGSSTGLLETRFTPIVQLTWLMFAVLPIKAQNATLLWVTSYTILLLGIIVNIKYKENSPDLFEKLFQNPSITIMRLLPLHNQDVEHNRIVTTYILLGLGMSIASIYIYFINNFHRRLAFIKLSRNVLLKKQRDSAISVKLHWMETLMPNSIKNEFWECSDEWIYNKAFDNVSILFADIIGFTIMNSNRTAIRFVTLLNDLFNRFDELSHLTNCEKLCPLGDCYYCISGCPVKRSDHALSCVEMGLGMVRLIRRFNHEHHENLNLQIGIHSGQVYGAIIGIKRFRFDIFSHDVNIAKAMESSGQPGYLHISEMVYNYIDNIYAVQEGMDLEFDEDDDTKRFIKLKSNLRFKTYFIDSKNPYLHGNNDLYYNKDDLKVLNGITRKFSSDSNEIDDEDYNSDKTNYHNKVTKDVELLDQIILDTDKDVNLIKNPPLSIILMRFLDKETEWHYCTQKWNDGKEGDLEIIKYSPILDSGICFLYTLTLYIGFCILFPRLSSKYYLVILAANLLSIIIILLLLWQFFETKDQSLNPRANSIYNFFTKNNLMIFLHFIYFVSSPIVIFIFILHDCNKINFDYNFTIKYFTILFFSLFTIPLYLSATYCMKISICIINGLLVSLVLTYKLCMKRTLNYTFPHYTCLGQMNITDVSFYKNVQSNFCLQIIVTCLSMILLIREVESNVRALFAITRELEINNEDTSAAVTDTQEFLYNIIPKYVFNELKLLPDNQKDLTNFKYAVSIPKAAVIFACISNLFSKNYQKTFKERESALNMLHKIICTFDDILEREVYKDVEKIKTINDCYLVASGLNLKRVKQNTDKNEHLYALMYYAFDIIEALDYFNEHCLREENKFLIKIGYNFGPVIAGLIGGTKPMYDIWGDTVNMCSKMQSTGLAGSIQVCEHVKDSLRTEFHFKSYGNILDKSNTELETFICVGPLLKYHDIYRSSSLQIPAYNDLGKIRLRKYSLLSEKKSYTTSSKSETSNMVSFISRRVSYKERMKSMPVNRIILQPFIDKGLTGFTFKNDSLD